MTDWKTWRSEVEDYCEVVKNGMKEILEKVRTRKDQIEEEHVEAETTKFGGGLRIDRSIVATWRHMGLISPNVLAILLQTFKTRCVF